MNEEKLFAIGLVILLACLLSSVFYGVFVKIPEDQAIRMERFRRLRQEGFKIVNATIKSPSVIIDVESFDDFVDKAKDLGSDIIYYDKVSANFYVFTKDYEIAYRFYVERL